MPSARWAVTKFSCFQIAEQTEVETEGSSEDRVAAEEIDLHLHRIAHPAKDVDIIPALLVVVARWVVVDTHLVVVLRIVVVAVAIEVGLHVGLEDGLQGR